MLLKARVCKTPGIPDFFDFDNAERKKLKNESVITKPYKVHDYEQLFILSGIYRNFGEELDTNELFKLHWSSVVKWNENSRYMQGANSSNVKDFITSVKEIMVWIQKHL